MHCMIASSIAPRIHSIHIHHTHIEWMRVSALACKIDSYCVYMWPKKRARYLTTHNTEDRARTLNNKCFPFILYIGSVEKSPPKKYKAICTGVAYRLGNDPQLASACTTRTTTTAAANPKMSISCICCCALPQHWQYIVTFNYKFSKINRRSTQRKKKATQNKLTSKECCARTSLASASKRKRIRRNSIYCIVRHAQNAHRHTYRAYTVHVYALKPMRCTASNAHTDRSCNNNKQPESAYSFLFIYLPETNKRMLWVALFFLSYEVWL